MRIVKFKGKDIYIKSNVLTPFFYKQEFNKDFYKDLLEWIKSDSERLGLKITWSLSKSIQLDLLDYDQWILLFNENETNWESIKLEAIKFLTETKSNQKKNTNINEHYAVKLVISALKSGISIEALQILLPQDLINSLDDTEMASQEQIDAFLG